MPQIKVATPVSTLFTQTSRLDEILALSDALEVRNNSESLDSPLSRIFHCEACILEPWSEEQLKEIIEIIQSLSVSFVSFHLCSCFIAPPVVDGMFQPEGQRMSETEMIQNALHNQKKFFASLGAPIGMAVENNNFYPTGAYAIVTDPNFINQLAEKLSMHILLDIAHAQVTAANQGVSLDAYLNGIDFSKVVQVHLSRPKQELAVCRDAHMALEPEDWQLAKKIINRCPNLQFATLEYYQNDTQLIAMLKKLKTLIA